MAGKLELMMGPMRSNKTAELLRRGYTNEDIMKILGRNVLRVMRAAEQESVRLQAERPPSTAVIGGRE